MEAAHYNNYDYSTNTIEEFAKLFDGDKEKAEMFLTIIVPIFDICYISDDPMEDDTPLIKDQIDTLKP
jgi:hypothetical protein